MIPNEEGWHYLEVKKLGALLRKVTSKHHSGFYFLNCFHFFATENKRGESDKEACESRDFCNVVMSSKGTQILEFHQNRKSDEESFIIYSEFECLIEKFEVCKNNPENSFTINVGEHIPSAFQRFRLS